MQKLPECGGDPIVGRVHVGLDFIELIAHCTKRYVRVLAFANSIDCVLQGEQELLALVGHNFQSPFLGTHKRPRCSEPWQIART